VDLLCEDINMAAPLSDNAGFPMSEDLNLDPESSINLDPKSSINFGPESSMNLEQSLPTVQQITGRSLNDEVVQRRSNSRIPLIAAGLMSVLGVVAAVALVFAMADPPAGSNSAPLSYDMTKQPTLLRPPSTLPPIPRVSQNEPVPDLPEELEEELQEEFSDFIPTAPAVAPIETQRFDMISDYLVTNNVLRANSIPSESQNLALTWMAEEDSMQLAVPGNAIDSDSGYEFIQRFVMAVIYFDLDGEKWKYDMNFMKETDVCGWYRILLSRRGATKIGVDCGENSKIHGVKLVDNGMKGSIPTEMGLLTSMKILQLDANELTSTIPFQFSALKNLEGIHMSHNELTGPVPDFFASFSALKDVDLSFNLLDGFIPPEMAELQSLEALMLDHNALEGDFSFFGASPVVQQNMSFFFAENNQFSGMLDETFFEHFPKLEMVDISDNKFGGSLPSSALSQPRLVVLDLHDNMFKGTIPFPETLNEKLRFLALHRNLFDGVIPPAVGNLKYVFHLDLSENSLAGELPIDIGNMTALEYLFVAKNAFDAGPIPEFLSNLSNLEELSLKSTQRMESIPTFISGLANLILLDLDDNQLTGGIPTEMGGLNNLQFLLLNRNQLTEEFPQELADLRLLRLMYIDGNQITGDLNSICNRDTGFFKPIMVADCGGDTPDITCDCCRLCCSTEQKCHTDDLVPSNDPLWQFGYDRLIYDFGNYTGYFESLGFRK